ncbi:MAG TPA: ATP-binding protein, partial [Acidimicrobiia bacterium]|nr:ATP-binding protein [Acidimicrobiia bacterium]
RADTMPVTVVSQRLDVETLCRDVLAEHRADSVTCSFEARLMWADPHLVRRIVGNLVGNALRYGGPDVRLRVFSSGPDTVIQVSDDGPAIPADERDRIFDGDLRSGQRVTSPAAVGLSLTVGRHLARLMEGDVEYFRQGGRNLFELRLPSEQITEPPMRRESTTSLEPSPI